VEAVITGTLEATPEQATHWSTRSMAQAIGLSQSAVSRIWRAFSLQPHRVETFKLSSDPFFIEKVRDIVGLYLNPPERALVLCVDEKSQIQALDRTRPVLPLRPGVPARQSHDYVRNGTTSLFAALDIATGKVIGSLHHRQRHQEFLRFLEKVDTAIPESLDIHLVMDNYGTQQNAEGEAMVCAPAALPFALHSNQRQLAESSRAFLRTAYGSSPPARHFWKCPRIGISHPRLSGAPQ